MQPLRPSAPQAVIWIRVRRVEVWKRVEAKEGEFSKPASSFFLEATRQDWNRGIERSTMLVNYLLGGEVSQTSASLISAEASN